METTLDQPAAVTPLQALETKLQPFCTRLAAHPLYASLRTARHLQIFLESHVFAVWDFMSLLKALQRGLTCIDVPWTPSSLPESRRLINEIVLAEESDVFEGRPFSHFEIYRIAMQRSGASTATIDTMLAHLREGATVERALAQSNAPLASQAFVWDTFSLIAEDKLHVTAAAFTFGREDLIPEMFKGFVRDLNRQVDGSLETFLWYLERHIEVDGDEHGPMALRMIAELCGTDGTKWAEAERAAVFALESRLRLWDGILTALP